MLCKVKTEEREIPRIRLGKKVGLSQWTESAGLYVLASMQQCEQIFGGKGQKFDYTKFEKHAPRLVEK